MRRQIKIIVFGAFLTLLTIPSHGQCSFLAGKLEAGHDFKKNVGHGLDPKKELKGNDIISLVKIDSIGSTNSSWYVAILFNDKVAGHVDVEFQFQNKKLAKTKGQRPRLSQLDTMYFDDNELLFPIDSTDVQLIIDVDIVGIRINSELKHITFSPEKNILKRMSKCLM
jgi:hypothetical protein